MCLSVQRRNDVCVWGDFFIGEPIMRRWQRESISGNEEGNWESDETKRGEGERERDSLDWTSPAGTGRCCGQLETLPARSDKRISDNPSHDRICSPPDPRERETQRKMNYILCVWTEEITNDLVLSEGVRGTKEWNENDTTTTDRQNNNKKEMTGWLSEQYNDR